MNVVKLGVVLMLFAGIASGGLSLLNNKTAPIIAAEKARMQAEARADVARSLGVDHFDKIETPDGFTYWRAYDADSNAVGYVALARGKGYSSTIETICGFDDNFKVSGIKITFQQETPGLGTKSVQVKKGAKEPWFQKQFKGKDGLTLAVKKDRGDIDAITAATITSRGVTNSVRAVAEKIRDEVKKQGPQEQPATADAGEAANQTGGEESHE